jgi:hypothetical protein
MGGAEVEFEKTIRRKGTLHNKEKDCRRFEIPEELCCDLYLYNCIPQCPATIERQTSDIFGV